MHVLGRIQDFREGGSMQAAMAGQAFRKAGAILLQKILKLDLQEMRLHAFWFYANLQSDLFNVNSSLI